MVKSISPNNFECCIAFLYFEHTKVTLAFVYPSFSLCVFFNAIWQKLFGDD